MLLGKVIEHAPTGDMFVAPRERRTADYIEGRYVVARACVSAGTQGRSGVPPQW